MYFLIKEKKLVYSIFCWWNYFLNSGFVTQLHLHMHNKYCQRYLGGPIFRLIHICTLKLCGKTNYEENDPQIHHLCRSDFVLYELALFCSSLCLLSYIHPWPLLLLSILLFCLWHFFLTKIFGWIQIYLPCRAC